MAEKEYPKELTDSFIACKKSKWTDEAYAAYKVQVNKYLKGKAEDNLECSKLTVELARATSHLFKKADNNVEEQKTKKTKATKELARRKRKVQKLSGTDKGQEERTDAETVSGKSQGE